MRVGRVAAAASLLVLLSLSGLSWVSAQEGRGSLNVGFTSAGSFDNFRHLFAVDEQGRLIPATDETGGLVTSWTVEYGDFASEDGTITGKTLVTYRLRDDLTWQDGMPITSADVFFSMIDQLGQSSNLSTGEAILSRVRSAAAFAPVSPYEFAILFTAEGCGALEELEKNPAIEPVHVIAPEFADSLDVFSAASSVADGYEAWQAERASYLGYIPFDLANLSAASPQFTYVDYVPNEYLRLLSDKLAVTIWADLSSLDRETDAFLSGDVDVVVNPPYNRRADLYGLPGVQLVEPVGRTWYALGFNVADPAHPASAFNEKTGEAQDQGSHPILSDLRLRKLLVSMLDIDALGAAATSGYYTRLTSDQLPGTWADSDVFAQTQADPVDLGRQLDELGWRDWDGSGRRECHSCATAEENTPLSFNLIYSYGDQVPDIIVRGIAEQLGRFGVQVNAVPYDPYGVSDQAMTQSFDAYLLEMTESMPVAADHGALFQQDQDVLNNGSNVTSYVNPDLEAAFDRAAHAPQCDYDMRAAALHDASAIIAQELPYVPLFAVNDLYAAQGAVEGFAPRRNDPFWNMTDWVINR